VVGSAAAVVAVGTVVGILAGIPAVCRIVGSLVGTAVVGAALRPRGRAAGGA
jgi:hypothetical protein